MVGHLVSAMIGMLANLAAPELYPVQIMIGPSPCYINDADYVGGFTRTDNEGLLSTLEGNYLGWSAPWRRRSMPSREDSRTR